MKHRTVEIKWNGTEWEVIDQAWIISSHRTQAAAYLSASELAAAELGISPRKLDALTRQGHIRKHPLRICRIGRSTIYGTERRGCSTRSGWGCWISNKC